jgi:hypothetical protein
MQKYFNTTGPCIEKWHYMLDATERLHDEVTNLIDNGQYFVIHAARQVGKTTLLLEMAQKLNREGNYHALYCSLEDAYGMASIEQGVPTILSSIRIALNTFKLPFYKTFAKEADKSNNGTIIQETLTAYCTKLDKPLVIFFDEADCLSEDTLISFFRQLRNGYVNRALAPFPASVALVGMRNLRDYKVQIRPKSNTLGTASPFNVIKESLTMRNFNKNEVAMLYKQHTDTTGQVFETSATELVYEQTQGQPWLVNAIAAEVVEKQLKKDYGIAITAQMINEAIQTIIKRRDVHIDQLLDKLQEQRVRKIIEPMMLGDTGEINRMSNDFNYVLDLGLIKAEKEGIKPANPIYAEVIIRTLSYNSQADFAESDDNQYEMPRYYKDGKIDMALLLGDFQEFWRENSEIWESRYQYKEAAPHLILQAFLQRIINGGGQIIREIASGRRRLDLCIVYKDKKYPIELKILRGSKTEQDGLQQTEKYMDTLGCKEGWLVIFDRTPNKSWDEKIYTKTVTTKTGKTIAVVGA